MGTSVYIYGGEATYSGSADFDWASPVTGARHKFMLFLSQETDAAQDQTALVELAAFGFIEINLISGKPIQVEALNNPRMKAFHRHYEGALSDGSSLVWYPQDLRESYAS